MGSNEKLELVISVDAGKANKAIVSVNTSILGLEKQTTSSSGGMAKVWERSAADTAQATQGTKRAMKDASDAAQLLGAQIGIQLPREVRKFIAESKLLGTVLSGLFKFSIYLAAGEALVSWVGRIGEKLGWWGDQAEKAKQKNDELTKSVQEQQKQIEDYYANLERAQQARELIGLSGSARAAKEVEQGKTAIDKAKLEYEAAIAQYNRTYFELEKAKHPKSSGWKGTEADLQALLAKGTKADELVGSTEQALNLAKENYLTLQKELGQVQKEEAEARAKELQAQRQKADEAWLQQQIEISQRYLENKVREQEGRIALERDVNEVLARMNQEQMAEDERVWKEYWEKRRQDVESLARENQNMVVSQLRQGKDYLGVQAIELQRLDELKNLYADNAEAIALIEERKKLVIQDTNQQIAQDAQSKFEKSADQIERFFDRVFLQARSFSDVWKQLLSQMASYAVSTVAKMVASWSMGMRQMSPAAGGAGSGGMGMTGMLDGMTSMLTGSGGLAGPGGGIAGISQSGAVSNASAVSGNGSGGLAGMFNQGASGRNLKDFLGIGGLKPAGGIGPTLPFGQMSLGGKLSAIGKSNAALMAGGMLGMYGLQRGGLSGLGMTTAGGALIGYKYGGGLGAAIGAGIGAAAGLVRLFMKGAEAKVREKVKAAYGVDIKDKSVRQQIVDIAKQSYGGNLDMAIRTTQVADLVRLYAMTTGQNTSGLPKQMSASTLVQSGGNLYQQKQYVNGLAAGMPGGIPVFHSGIDFVPRDMFAYLQRGERVTPAAENKPLPGASLAKASSGNSSSRPTGDTNIYLSPEAAQNLLTQGVLRAVDKNPRVVQRSSMNATRSNYNRRELAALQLSPGTLTS